MSSRPPSPCEELFATPDEQPSGVPPFSPLGQRILFPTAADDLVTNANSATSSGYLLSNESEEKQLNIAHVLEEAKEEGDTSSVADATEDVKILEASSIQSFQDRLEVLVKEQDYASLDGSRANDDFIQLSVLQEGVTQKINAPTIPEDWKVPQPKKNEPSFQDVDNPGSWSEFSFALKLVLVGCTSIMPCQQGVLLFQQMPMATELSMDGPSTTKSGRLILQQMLDLELQLRIFSHRNEEVILIMNCSRN